MLAVVIFLFDGLRAQRSVPLTAHSGIACAKHSRGTLLSVPVAAHPMQFATSREAEVGVEGMSVGKDDEKGKLMYYIGFFLWWLMGTY